MNPKYTKIYSNIISLLYFPSSICANVGHPTKTASIGKEEWKFGTVKQNNFHKLIMRQIHAK